MEQNNFVWGLILGGVVGIVIGIALSGGNNNEVTRDAMAQCEIVREDYLMALRDAEDNIEYANEQLDEARNYAWESYEDMGYVLESLEEVEEADDPGTICY